MQDGRSPLVASGASSAGRSGKTLNGAARRANLSLLLLTLVAGVSASDRRLISLLIEPIRAEFHLSDTQLGIITGPAYALVAPLVALPIGMLIDRTNRKLLILVSLALFSAMTFAHGLALGFATLLIARIGVAMGEATVDPGTISVLSDYFEGPRRTRALSVLYLSSSIGAAVAFLFGGWFVQLYGWRRAAELFGVPGGLMVIAGALLLREPVRGGGASCAASRAGADASPGLWETVRFVLTQPAYRAVAFGFAFCFSTITGEVAWSPALFARRFGTSPAEMGTALSLLIGVFSAAGTLAIGALAARLSVRDVRWNLRLVAIVQLLIPPLAAGVLFAPSPGIALIFAIPVVFLMLGHGGPTNAMKMALAPVRMRGMALAVGGVVTMGVELLCGPFAIGALSDLYRPWSGEASLRLAMLTTSLGWVAAAGCFWRASLSVERDIAAAERYAPVLRQPIAATL